MKTYQIPVEDLSQLEREIERIARRAEKLGVQPPRMEVGETELITIKLAPMTEGFKIKVANVTIFGEAPKLAGWAFIATIEHMGDGNLIRTYPWIGEEIQIPAKYRQVSQYCDHCGVNRDRKDTYIVHHAERNEWKQVGSTCLKDFTGANNPHRAASYLQALSGLFSMAEDLSDPEGWGSMGFGLSHYIDTELYLAFVAMMIERSGWASRSKSDFPTADQAIIAMQEKDKGKRLEPAESHRNLAKDALAWIRGIENAADLKDYMWNLYLVCDHEVITKRHIGIAASLIMTYKRHLEREFTRQTEAVVSEWQGQINKRQQFSNLQCAASIPSEGYWGVTYVTKLLDPNGNHFVWFTSTSLTEGLVYSGKATVKDHSEFRGVKQTVLTRCKFEVVGGEIAE